MYKLVNALDKEYVREDFHVKMLIFHVPVVTGSEWSVLLVACITDGTFKPR